MKKIHGSVWQSITIGVVLLGTIFYTWQSRLPAGDDYQSTELTKFSQLRVLEHLTKITQKTHAVGSDEHIDVRNYIVNQLQNMGLEVEIDDGLALSSRGYNASKVENIIARKQGLKSVETGNKALVLTTHYDSEFHTLGAGDAGVGVFSILEAMRAFIASGTSHQNDIIIVITDAEEQGLLGAEHFMATHPWADDIGLALNFEARGSGGPAYMLLETNYGNSKLIQSFASADISHPVSNSLAYSIYKKLPNDTDLTVFREQGDVNGMVFSFIDDHFDYHTMQDSVERLDRNTINHQADYLTHLIPYFSNVDLTALNSDDDDVFFSFADLAFFSYAFSLAWPLWVMAALGLVGIMVLLVKKEGASCKSIALSFLPAVLATAVTAGIGWVGWELLVFAFPQYLEIPQGFTYNGYLLLSAFILLSIAATFSIYQRFVDKTQLGSNSLLVAPMFLWLLINLGFCIYLPGGSFFIIPLIATILTVFTALLLPKSKQYIKLIGVLFALPGLIILTPQIPTFVVGLGMSVLFVSTMITGLYATLLVPLVIGLPLRRWLSVLTSVSGIVILLVAISQSDYSDERKKSTSVNYLYDTGSDKAYLYSFNSSYDEFIGQFFEAEERYNQELDESLPFYIAWNIGFAKQVNKLPILPAKYIARVKRLEENRYAINLKITPNEVNSLFNLVSANPITIESMTLNGKTFKRKNRTYSYNNYKNYSILSQTLASESSTTIELIVNAKDPIKFRLIETWFNFPEVWPNYKPRSEIYMPTPFLTTDATIISQPIVFDSSVE